jgi:hypothetical protein
VYREVGMNGETTKVEKIKKDKIFFFFSIEYVIFK